MGKRKEIFIIDRVAYEWERLGTALGFETPVIRAYERNHLTVQERCTGMMRDWLSGQHHYELVAWKTFLNALDDIRENVLSEDIKKVLFFAVKWLPKMSTLYIAKITLLKRKSRIYSFLFVNIVGHTQLLCSTDAAHEPLNREAKCSSSGDIVQVSLQVSLHMICSLTATSCGLHFTCREKIALYPHLGFLTKERYCFITSSSKLCKNIYLFGVLQLRTISVC